MRSVHSRQLSAASIFSHYLDSRAFDELQSKYSSQEELAKPKKCGKCRTKCFNFWTCSACRKGRKGSGKSEEFSDDEEIVKPRRRCCWRLRSSGQGKSHVSEEEEEWQEDLGRVQHVTTGFKEWLTHTYRKDKKAPATVRKERMKARRSWNRSVVSTNSARERGSIISLKFNESRQTAINDLLSGIDTWNFDSFDLDEKTDRHSLTFVVSEVFKAQDFVRKFRIKIPALKNLLKALEAGYSMNGNPYHNQRHGADVTQTVHSILNSRPGIYNMFTDLEIFALIFAAIVHDLAHPGTTNNFHINAQTHLALLYNDKSVLENHHVSSAFQILKNQSCNILENLKTDEFKEFRELVIELVLATDMVAHFQNLKTIRTFLRVGEWDGTSHKAISTTLSLILHAADIANPAKPWPIHKRCTDAVMQEYLAQGAQETHLRIPVSPLCDAKSQTPATQITFIEVIVQPTFQALGDLMDMILAYNNASADTNLDSRSMMFERRRLTIIAESTDRIPSMNAGRMNRGSIFASIRNPRGSKQADENFLLLRPWIPHIAANIAEWKSLQQAEGPSSLTSVRKITEDRRKSTKEKKNLTFKPTNKIRPSA